MYKQLANMNKSDLQWICKYLNIKFSRTSTQRQLIILLLSPINSKYSFSSCFGGSCWRGTDIEEPDIKEIPATEYFKLKDSEKKNYNVIKHGNAYYPINENQTPYWPDILEEKRNSKRKSTAVNIIRNTYKNFKRRTKRRTKMREKKATEIQKFFRKKKATEKIKDIRNKEGYLSWFKRKAKNRFYLRGRTHIKSRKSNYNTFQ